MRISDTNGRTSALNVSVIAANANSLAWAGAATSVAGTLLSPTLSAYDAYGNLSTVYRGTVNLTSNDANATLPSAYPFTASDSGAHLYNGNIILRTAGSRTVTATDTNAAAGVQSGILNVTVSPNSPAGFGISLPSLVQPTQPFSAIVASTDAYGNATPTYAATVSLFSTDTNGTPSTTSPLTLTFTGTGNGNVAIGNLRLRTVGNQGLVAQDSGNANLRSTAATSVQAQNFTTAFYFNSATMSSYTYSASALLINQNNVALAPTYTTAGDTNASTFQAGVSSNLQWDPNGYLRLGASPNQTPYIFITGLEPNDPNFAWANTVDTGNGNISNVGAFCCGLTAPETNPNTAFYHNGSTSMMYGGSANGGNVTQAYTKVWSMQNANMVLSANSLLTYWIFPQAAVNASGNPVVNGNNSLYTSLNVVFADGTDSVSASITDANNVLLRPQSQGAGGHITLGRWNYVEANLSALAGKRVDHISIAWRYDGATGGYRGFIDDIYLSGVNASSALSNSAMLAADWTPRWSNLVGYWPFDGTGKVVNNANVVGAVGPTLTAYNAGGTGLAYVPGKVNQALYFDGTDDYLGFSNSSNFVMNTPRTVAYWYRPQASTLCSAAFSLGTTSSDYITYSGASCAGYNGRTVIFTSQGGGAGLLVGKNHSDSLNVWHHIAVTANGGNTLTYVDGALNYLSNTIIALPNTQGFYVAANNRNGVYLNLMTGMVDELALWNTTLSPNEVAAIYRRQRSAYSGTLTSHVINTPFAGHAPTGLTWSASLPFGKSLPGYGLSESPNDYPGLPGSALNANILGAWRFNEASLGTVPGGDFFDESGAGNTGIAWVNSGATAVQPNVSGVVGAGVHIDGFTYAGVTTSQAFVNPQVFTLQIWFRSDYSTPSPGGKLVGFGSSQTGLSSSWDRHIYLDSKNAVNFGVFSGTAKVITSPQSYGDKNWHQAVATLSATGMKLYVDGALVATDVSTTAAQNYTGYWRFGCDSLAGGWPNVGSTCVAGDIDEPAVWGRALSDAEVATLYRRYSNRVKLQVRTCTSNTCSDNPNWGGARWHNAYSLQRIRQYREQLHPDWSGLPLLQHGSTYPQCQRQHALRAVPHDPRKRRRYWLLHLWWPGCTMLASGVQRTDVPRQLCHQRPCHHHSDNAKPLLHASKYCGSQWRCSM